MIMNRISDVFFLFGILLVLIHFKTTDFLVLNDLVKFYLNSDVFFFKFNFKLIDLISFFLLLGAVGKSAQ